MRLATPTCLFAFVVCATLIPPRAATADTADDIQRLEATSMALADALRRLDADDGTAERSAELLARARAALAAGQDADAQAQADEGYRLLRDRIRSVSALRSVPVATAAEPPPTASPAFVARRSAALELRAAALRVADEKHADPGFVGTFDRDLALADTQAGDGQHDAATATLQRAYDGIKGALVSLRDGDTLVRSLSFANAEEEFAYERDRNDTFAMLVPLLTGEAVVDERVAGYLSAAKALRKEAEAAGGAGRFEAGIDLLDRSSQEYRKVIRNAGVLLPG